MLEILLLVLILPIGATLVLVFRLRQEVYLLRLLAYQAFSLEEVIEANKQAVTSRNAVRRIEKHDTDEYFEKRAKWEFDDAIYKDLLESNLAVLNGIKKINNAVSDHFSNFGAPAEIEYIKNKIDKWKAIRTQLTSQKISDPSTSATKPKDH